MGIFGPCELNTATRTPNFKKRKMDESTISECNLTMLATQSFNHILDQIQTSCLNFQIQISPFSAIISLKKSIIRDQSGKPLLSKKLSNISSEDIDTLVMKNRELERKLEEFQNFKQVACIKVEANSSEQNKIKELEDVLSLARDILKDRGDKILELQVALKAAKEASCKTNNILVQNRAKFEKEKTVLLKEHRAEVKAWKKDLGEERKEKIKLEKELKKVLCANKSGKMDEKKQTNKTGNQKVESKVSTLQVTNSKIVCSICAHPIDKFQPEYFCGEMFNPSCQTCKSNDSSWLPDDPFSSFPSDSQPASLVSHWLLPLQQSVPQNPSSIATLLTHCVKLPNPGDSFLSMEEILELMRNLFEEMRGSFKF